MRINEESSGIELRDSKLGISITYDGDGEGNPSVKVYEKDAEGKIVRSHKIYYAGITIRTDYDLRGYSHVKYSSQSDKWFDLDMNEISEKEYNNTRN